MILLFFFINVLKLPARVVLLQKWLNFHKDRREHKEAYFAYRYYVEPEDRKVRKRTPEDLENICTACNAAGAAARHNASCTPAQSDAADKLNALQWPCCR